MTNLLQRILPGQTNSNALNASSGNPSNPNHGTQNHGTQLLGNVVQYARQEGIAQLLSHKLPNHRDSWLQNLVKLGAPKYYPALVLSEKKGIGNQLLALAFPVRYSAYQLSRQDDQKVSLLETAGILLCPEVVIAGKAFFMKKPEETTSF